MIVDLYKAVIDFGEKFAKIRSNKNKNFFAEISFVFYKKYSYQKFIRSDTSSQTLIHRYKRGSFSKE